MKISDDIIRQIKELGGDDGFWKSDAEARLRESVQELVDAGVEEQRAFSIVAGVWYLASSEYGN